MFLKNKKKKENLISPLLPHSCWRLISFSFVLWNSTMRAKEKSMFIVFGKVQKFFFLSNTIIEMNIYISFFLSLSHTLKQASKQESVKILPEAGMTIHESFKLCRFSSFFFLLHQIALLVPFLTQTLLNDTPTITNRSIKICCRRVSFLVKRKKRCILFSYCRWMKTTEEKNENKCVKKNTFARLGIH